MASSYKKNQCAFVAEVKENDTTKKVRGNAESSCKKQFKCYQCSKHGYMKRNFRTKLKKSILVGFKISTKDEEWAKCFLPKNTHALASKISRNEWILDFGFSHHITGDNEQFTTIYSMEKMKLESWRMTPLTQSRKKVLQVR